MKLNDASSLYIHIPFCERKCFYCSFVVVIAQDQKTGDYLECLSEEMRLYKGTRLASVYLGGGTPTYLSAAQLEKLFKDIKKNFSFQTETEFTIEANPEGLTSETLEMIKDFGVNRLSLGVQTLSDRHLKYLGRCHDAKQALDAFDLVRKKGFRNVNLDLMFSFPQQSLDEIKEDVRLITALGSEHLSLYTLTIEENSRFYAAKIRLDEREELSLQYLFVLDLLKQTPFRQYEVSNFAKTGKESRHNLNYWKGGACIGLGVGAHSYWGGQRFWNVSRIDAYMSKIRQKESPVETREELSNEKRFMEILLIGLRMNTGVNVGDLQKQMNVFLPDDKRKKIDDFIEQGFFVWNNKNLIATDKGRLVLDELSGYLI